jgi:hypothetical protein
VGTAVAAEVAVALDAGVGVVGVCVGLLPDGSASGVGVAAGPGRTPGAVGPEGRVEFGTGALAGPVRPLSGASGAVALGDRLGVALFSVSPTGWD